MPDTPAEDPATLRRSAQAALQAGRLADAQAHLRRLLGAVPDDHAARLELAQVRLGLGQLQDAVADLLDIVAASPADVRLLAQLVPLLQWAGEVNAARACLDRLAGLSGTIAPLWFAQANARYRLGEIDAARDAMQRAVAAGAEGPDVVYLKGMLEQFTGDLGAAESTLRSCLQRWPGFGSAAVVLANLRRQTPASNVGAFLDGLASQLPPESSSPQARKVHAEYASARFKVLDDLGQTDAAWTALSRSNALMHAMVPYDARAEVAITDALIGLADALAGDSGDAARPEGPMPIFIVGLPRSGSTLLERMLSAHSQVASAGEINDFLCQLRWMADVPPQGDASLLEAVSRGAGMDHDQLGRRYLQQTQWRAAGRGFYVDKMLVNIRMVPLIRRALPHAPILHMVRDPMDVCFSNLKVMFGPSSPYSYDMQAMVHYHAQYARLVAHLHRALPGAMLDVPYADLVRDPGTTMHRVLDHCGLTHEPGCLSPENNHEPVATRSTAQVREAIHARGLGGWQRYAGPLAPLRDALNGD